MKKRGKCASRNKSMMSDHDLAYYESYSASDSLSLEDMIASDMREEPNGCMDGHHSEDVVISCQNNNNWLSQCAHACDTSIDFDTSGLLVNPKTGTPVISGGAFESVAAAPVSPYLQLNISDSIEMDENISKGDSTFTSVSSSSSSSSEYSSSSSSSSSSSEDEVENTVNDVFDSAEIEHVSQQTNLISTDKYYPKPLYSYSCLIAMALKNSETGCLRVSEIYNFMTKNYPYFKTAPNGWKNSVRHNLSLSQCFTKVDMPATKQRKGCLWTMNPDKIEKMDDEVFKWSQKDPIGIKQSMAKPEDFGVLEKFCERHERQMEDIQQDLAIPPINYNRYSKHSVKEAIVDQEMIIKDEPESEINLDNSLLDSTYHVDFWGELEEKLEFDIPLTGFPNTCNQFLNNSNVDQNITVKDNPMMISGAVSFSQPSRSLKIKTT